MKKTLLSMTVLLLSACGSGDGSSGTAVTEPPPDAFTSKVLDMAASAPEAGEAGTVDALTATTPEDTQPMPLI